MYEEVMRRYEAVRVMTLLMTNCNHERRRRHRSLTDSKAVQFLRATARSAMRVLAVVILSVCTSACLSRPGTDLSPGEIETPGFYLMIAQSFL